MIKDEFKIQRHFKKIFLTCGFLLSFLCNISLSFGMKTSSLFSQDLKKLLNSLPEKSITLDLILGLGIRSSDDFKMIQNRKLSEKFPYWKSKNQSRMDYYFSGGFHFLDDRGDSKLRTDPEILKNQSYFLKFSKTFATGTELSTEWNYGFTDLTYPKIDLSSSHSSFQDMISYFRSLKEFYNSELSFSLSQSLWKNRFGQGIRNHLQSSLMEKDIRNFEIEEKIEEWTFQMAEIFYKAWLQQQKIRLAKGNLKRQNRWLKITKIKASRGTAERSDVLQLKSSSIFSEQKKEQIQQSLENLWRSLVISLKLSESLTLIDPFLLPMKVSFQRYRALSFCESKKNKDFIFEKNVEIQKLQKILRSKELMNVYWRDQMRPEISFKTRIGANGIDEKSFTTLEDTLKGEHLFWNVGIFFNFPLSRFHERAELAKSTEIKTESEIRLRKRKRELQLNWINECNNLQRNVDQIKNYQKAYKMQKERSRLEERRFRIGRIPVSHVIQAGDDVTRSEQALYESIYRAEMISWKIYKMEGYILKYLKERFQSLQISQKGREKV